MGDIFKPSCCVCGKVVAFCSPEPFKWYCEDCTKTAHEIKNFKKFNKF